MTMTPSTSELRFDPEKHQYWIGKKRIPGVSEILQKVGLTKKYDGVDPFYRDRGIATHKAIELHLQRNLDITSIDDAIRPQFDAFLKYWDQHKYEKILALEKPMSFNNSFAGTPDVVTDTAIYDWKCSKNHDKVAELQGQAYIQLAIFQGPEFILSKPFIVVELHDDGTFAEFNYGNGFEQWSSVLDLYQWRCA